MFDLGLMLICVVGGTGGRRSRPSWSDKTNSEWNCFMLAIDFGVEDVGGAIFCLIREKDFVPRKTYFWDYYCCEDADAYCG